jgi:hypothetical protein
MRGGGPGTVRGTRDPFRHQVIYIANPSIGTRGHYVTVVRALGVKKAVAELTRNQQILSRGDVRTQWHRYILIQRRR